MWLTVKGGWCRGGIAIQFGWHCAFKLMVLWPTLELLLGSIVTTQVQASLKQLIWVMGSGFSKFSKKIPETTGIVNVAKLFLTKFWEHTICVSVKIQKKTTFLIVLQLVPVSIHVTLTVCHKFSGWVWLWLACNLCWTCEH